MNDDGESGQEAEVLVGEVGGAGDGGGVRLKMGEIKGYALWIGLKGMDHCPCPQS